MVGLDEIGALLDGHDVSHEVVLGKIALAPRWATRMGARQHADEDRDRLSATRADTVP